jgi:hypothetical protein
MATDNSQIDGVPIPCRFTAFKNSSPEYLQYVWSKNGFAYSCNGYIAARTSLELMSPEVLDASNKANIEKLCDLIDKNLSEACGDPIDLAGYKSTFSQERCPDCFGTGKQTICGDCEGNGEFEHGSHSYDCKECSGSGRTSIKFNFLVDPDDQATRTCDSCSGTKFKSSEVELCEIYIHSRYLNLICSLPNVHAQLDQKTSRLYFNFDGGSGFVLGRMERD